MATDSAIRAERDRTETAGGVTPFSRELTDAPRLQLALKRAMDIAVATVLLAILAPLFLLLALVVKLTSPGPILYRWRVVGRGGRYFTGYKFRTMVQDADRMKSDLLAHNEMIGPAFKMKNDPRVTPVGRFLRRRSLDELPQLWSVLKGDMSLVGPRPALQEDYERFTDWQKLRVAVKPGITCLWQVSGRNRISDFDEWVRLDLKYIEEWSLWLDITILLKTIPAVISGRGAS
ncbi:MAG: exopolysaccharide biosynthesis polyprenyl glycosylphosphotransferase [Dehalococcoidia bacterium]|nr:exopolysaccharide biosynthesis polyprenyl glycosylphosphotransferase [Dehalococcoidia bacterium]